MNLNWPKAIAFCFCCAVLGALIAWDKLPGMYMVGFLLYLAPSPVQEVLRKAVQTEAGFTTLGSAPPTPDKPEITGGKCP